MRWLWATEPFTVPSFQPIAADGAGHHMTLSEMRRLLDARDLQLTKSLGQNFLHDGNQLRRITAAAELIASDQVLEIGPGLGPLTELLLEQASHVRAIEKDTRLIPVLRERFADRTNLELVHADALDWLRAEPRDWAGWKLVANLPYSVASPILVELALALTPPDRLVATLQLEVVQRIAASPDTSDYGILTLLLGLRYEVRGWFKIPRDCFFPAPDVDSACVCLVRRPTALLPADDARVVDRIVKLAFSQRRKMMLKLLRQQWPGETLERAFNMAGIALTERAEKVSLEQFVRLTQTLLLPAKDRQP
jgi:16S rRNA (adenine1518-N6/adenine1519-N6)-dimethyltransferase